MAAASGTGTVPATRAPRPSGRAARPPPRPAPRKVYFNYPNEIFTLGQQLMNALEHTPGERPMRLAVGVVDVIPKPVARRLLKPAMQMDQAIRLTCHEDKGDRLLADLSARRLDVVISDGPIGAGHAFEGHNHLLGECGMSFFAAPEIARKYRRNFPKSLDGAPMLLPSSHTSVRRALDLWLDSLRIYPVVVADFDDGALMSSFGQDGCGIFPVPSIVEKRIQREMGVRLVGRTDQVMERFYAVSLDEKPKHPAVLAILEAARKEIFQ
jgi:LysR family transcriptional activator of nhaA